MKTIPKMKLPIVIIMFSLTLLINYISKPSINVVDADTLATEIVGIGKVKSTRIIEERERNGEFESKQDFYIRTKNLGIGEVVFNRIGKIYKF